MIGEIESAIRDADKGNSPKVHKLTTLVQQLTTQVVEELDSHWNESETVRQCIARIDSLIVGEDESQSNDDSTASTVSLLDDLDDFSHCLQQASNAETTTPFERALRLNEFRQHAKTLYMLLDEAMNERQHREILAELVEICPRNITILVLLDLRNRCTSKVRPVLHRLNLTASRLIQEINQSAMCRALYAELLCRQGKREAARQLIAEAYATNQVEEHVAKFRAMAMNIGVGPSALLNLAIKQHASGGKALPAEILIQEANRIQLNALDHDRFEHIQHKE
jgi:antitoxin component of RelBE/YafQ-DinJ toxin-antitoxin module